MATTAADSQLSLPYRRRRIDLTEVVIGGIAMSLASAFAAPVLAGALAPALAALSLWRSHKSLCAGLAGTALAALSAHLLTDQSDWLRYVEVQKRFGTLALDAVLAGQRVPTIPALIRYATATWRYALAYGVPLGLTTGTIAGICRTSRSVDSLRVEDAGLLATQPAHEIHWALERVLGRGVMTLLTAPQGLGKSVWVWSLLKTMQDGGTFFGTPVRRPWRGKRWYRRDYPLKILWLTEEGQSFTEKAREFGIRPGLLHVLRRDQIYAPDWRSLVYKVRKEAFAHRCAYIVVDTIRAWCPEAEMSNKDASWMLGLARKAWVEPGLGVLWLHHDRKAGGEYGFQVAGVGYLVGSMDVLVNLQRVKDRERTRRMVVSRRFGDMDLTATLDSSGRYVADDENLVEFDKKLPPPKTPVLPAHLQPLMDAILASPDGLSKSEASQVCGMALTSAKNQLEELTRRGLVARSGTGVNGSPYRWKVPRPTAKQDYQAYLMSPEWRVNRQPALDRAKGICERCHKAAVRNVHHLTYERVGHELPEDLIALCRSCHKRMHNLERSPA